MPWCHSTSFKLVFVAPGAYEVAANEPLSGRGCDSDMQRDSKRLTAWCMSNSTVFLFEKRFSVVLLAVTGRGFTA